MKKGSEKNLIVFVIINIVLLLVRSAYLKFALITQLDYVIGLGILTIFGLSLIIYCRVLNKIKINIIDIILIMLVLFGVIATVLAYNPLISLVGMEGRGEGLITIMYYYMLISACTLIKNKKIIIDTILVCGLIQVLYSFFQLTPLYDMFYHAVYFDGKTITGFVDYNNFWGTYTLICLSLAFVEGIFNKNNMFYLVSIILFYLSLLLANTMSAIIGLIVVILLIVLYIVINKKYKKLLNVLIVFVFMIISLLLFSTLKFTSLKEDIVETYSEILYASKNDKIEDSMGTDRIYVWRNAISIVPKHIWHGIGIDNFFFAFDKPLCSQEGFCYDKAHNEILQKLVTEGIFSTLFYITLILLALKNNVKVFKSNDINLLAIYISFIGYIAQSMFNISVINVAPLFYIMFGLLLNEYYVKKD